MNIHSSAVISSKARIADDVQIGPYCVIGDNVQIDSGCVLKSHVVIEKNTKIGKNNTFYPFCVIGVDPQDLKFRGEETFIEIGDDNVIREHATIHLGTKDGVSLTKIGNKNLLMVGIHIAHDCVVGNNIILANSATLAGHVTVEDHVIIGGLSAIHQFTRIGKGAMIGGMSAVAGDVVPHVTISGERATVGGLNLIGVKRRDAPKDSINDLRRYFKDVFQSQNSSSFKDRAVSEGKKYNSELVKDIVNFIEGETSRQFCQMKAK